MGLQKISRRGLSIILAVIMVMGLFVGTLPTNAAAAEFQYSQAATASSNPSEIVFRDFYKIANAQQTAIIPGLSAEDNLIPQGLTYWAEKNWFLISAYSADGSADSVIMAVDRASGEYVAEYILVGCKAHVGGIAASANNLYVAVSNAGIAYIPLSTLNAVGRIASVSFSGIVYLNTALGGANTAYCSFDLDSGILMAGNFYWPSGGYDKVANADYNSLTVGYDLSACPDSETEWSRFSSICNAPTFAVAYDDAVDRIQYAVYHDGVLYVSRSWSRSYSPLSTGSYISELDAFDIEPDSMTETVTIGGQDIPAAVTGKAKHTLKNLPMSEGICLIGSSLYNIYESGANKYNGGESNVCKYPTDHIWELDAAAIVNQVSCLERFKDIWENSWFYKAIKDMINRGLMIGTSATTFSPNEPMTRAMFVTVLSRLADINSAPLMTPFIDVRAGSYYADAVAWAAVNGIVAGMTPTEFAPDAQITRAQMAAILRRYARISGIDVSNTDRTAMNTFLDAASVPSWAADDVAWAVNIGLLHGDGIALNPNAGATRAEVAQVISNYCMIFGL